MIYKQTTQVPNVLLDRYLKDLSVAELKIFLAIIRQTNGWVNIKTKARKTRDRISHSQFMEKTRVCKHIIYTGINLSSQRDMLNMYAPYLD